MAELRAHLNAAAVGHASSQAAVRLSRLAAELPPSLELIGQAAIATLMEMVTSETSSRLVVGGMANLTRYGAEFETAVKPVLEALEEQVVLLKLLGEATTADAVTVRIGQENPYKELQSTSVVASGYGSQRRHLRHPGGARSDPDGLPLDHGVGPRRSPLRRPIPLRRMNENTYR